MYKVFASTLNELVIVITEKKSSSNKQKADKEFPDSTKLIMAMVTAWPSLFTYDSPLCRAIHIVSKLKARGNILDLLSKYLHWNEEPPEPIYSTIASTLKALLEDSSLTFQKNSWFGDDLCPAAWDYIFSLDLLCAQLGWTWTFTNIIRNEIWLILDTLLLQTRSEQTPYRDVSEAAVFRLLGRLGQLGLKENQTVSVRNLLKGIHTFLNQKLSKDMPWEVQLAMVYATHDLAPCNPKDTLKTLESWRQKIRQPVPPAVTKCLKQIGFLCHQNY
ncbi:little elongation complex subunit 1 [Silurus meridionalis]|nr:little elongation complex subunit 1 [Silurus meridionalis]